MMNMGWGAKIGIIIGIAGGIFGGVVAIAASPSSAFFVIPFYVIFILVFGYFLKPLYDAAQVMKNGLEATATVTRIWDTGVTLNNDPQIGIEMDVQPADGSPSFTSKTKMYISRLQTSAYQVGQVLTIKYDPANHAKVAIVSIGGGVGINSKDAEAMLKKNDDETRQILKSGLPAKAIVLEFSLMNINVNGNNPAVKLKLEVMPDGEEPFKADTMGVVMESSVPKYQPGKEIYVRYMANDKTKVAVDHS